MISASTAFRHFDGAPALSYWTLVTIASAITALVIIQVARNLYEWLRMWWYLRDVPKPKPKKSFTLLIDLYKQLSAMDPSLDMKVKFFKYLQGLFKSVEDQDVTVAFYGPYPLLLASTPQVVEAILGDTKNVDKAFFYDMMRSWVGESLLTLGGDAWRNRRKALLPGYHHRCIEGKIPIMNKRGERLMDKVASLNGGFFDMLPIARAATLGVLLEFFKYLQGLFKSVEDQDVTVAFYGPYPLLLASTPQVVEAILGDTKNVDKAFFYDMMRSWVGESLLTLGGDAWRNRRKALLPGYHHRCIEGKIPIMNKRGERLMDKVASLNGGFFDMLPIARAATLGVLLETLMGMDYDEEEIERAGYIKTHDAISDCVMNRFAKFHYWFDSLYGFSGEYKEMKRNVEKAREFVNTILQKRLADYKKDIMDPISSNSNLEFSLRMYVEGKITEIDMRDECLAGLIGGLDTTAINIAYTLYLLGLHPETQAKVHEEIDLVVGDDWHKPLTAEELKNLTYLECVLKESMRLYPPIPVIGRAVKTDIQIGDYTIPRGTVALVALYFLHRHPRTFESPDAFIPERFLDTKKMHTYAFAAFSAGPRNCLGQKFSMTEAKILITHILRRFEVTSKIPMEDLVLSFDLMLRPIQGLEIKLIPRRNPSAY